MGEKEDFLLPCTYTPVSTMSFTAGHEIFITSTPANFHPDAPARRTSRTNNGERRETAEAHGVSSTQRVPVSTNAEFTDLETVKRVLHVLKEGGMDVVAFLDALCWGNLPAITDPTVRSARTSLTHSDRLAGVVSRLLHPPRTSQGGSKAGGARRTLMPLIIDTVKEVIDEEMDAVVDALREESAEVTEKSVLGMVIDEVMDKVRVTAPVFFDLVRTAAWSEKQDERNKLKDPTTVSGQREF